MARLAVVNMLRLPQSGGRLDAGRGLWLRGTGGGKLEAVPGQKSGILVYGEQRGAALCDFDGDGRVDLAVSQNGAETKLYQNVLGKPGLRVRLNGPPGNPDGVGAMMRLVLADGWGRHGKSTAVRVTGRRIAQCRCWVARNSDGNWIRWPGGKTTTSPIPDGAKRDHRGHRRQGDNER